MYGVHPLDLATHLIVTDWNMGARLAFETGQTKELYDSQTAWSHK
jgi:hypothetical protein